MTKPTGKPKGRPKKEKKQKIVELPKPVETAFEFPASPSSAAEPVSTEARRYICIGCKTQIQVKGQPNCAVCGMRLNWEGV